MSKRAIIFSNYDDLRNPYYAGGGAIAIHEICKRLAENHEVVILTGRYPGCKNEMIDGVKYERIGMSIGGPKIGQIAFHFSLPNQVRRRDFHIWLESLTPPFSTACLQLFTTKPVLLVTQNLPGASMARKYKLPFHLVEAVGLRTYRFGIALSDVLRTELLRANPRMDITVIPNGVDPALIAQEAQGGGEYILFLGRIDIRQKGLDLLLAAFQKIAAECATPLVIAGSGIARQEATLKQRIYELGLEKHVRCIGRVTGEQKVKAFERASFLVMPSRFEGFPLTLLEAFCWKLPVVLFSIPELAWLPESCCVKIPPFDLSALAKAILALARDASLRGQMGAAGKDWVRPFGWDSLAKRYESLLTRIMETTACGSSST